MSHVSGLGGCTIRVAVVGMGFQFVSFIFWCLVHASLPNRLKQIEVKPPQRVVGTAVFGGRKYLMNNFTNPLVLPICTVRPHVLWALAFCASDDVLSLDNDSPTNDSSQHPCRRYAELVPAGTCASFHLVLPATLFFILHA
jgi:hypothetical protein